MLWDRLDKQWNNCPERDLGILASIFGIITLIGIVKIFIAFNPESSNLGFIIGINPYSYVWWHVAMIFLVGTEFFFWLDHNKPNSSDNLLKFTLERKVVAFFDVVLLAGCYGFSLIIYEAFPEFAKWVGIQQPYIWNFIQWIALILVGLFGVVGLLYGYIWINSRRYKKEEK